MATPVTNKPTTYIDRLNAELTLNASLQSAIQDLSTRVQMSPMTITPEIQQLIKDNKLDELRPVLTEGLALVVTLTKGRNIAQMALDQFRRTLASVPEKTEVQPLMRLHMEQLGCLAAYDQAETDCGAKRTELATIAANTDALVKNANVFIGSLKSPLNTIAYAVKKMDKQTGIRDYVPSLGYFYFEEALIAFQAPKPEVVGEQKTAAPTDAVSADKLMPAAVL